MLKLVTHTLQDLRLFFVPSPFHYVLFYSIVIFFVYLCRRTGSIFRGVNDGVKYMEMNIHVHKFATLAKQSIHYISSRCGQMFMQIGFVIEGREDTELPETMFACVAVNKPQEEKAEFIFDEEDP